MLRDIRQRSSVTSMLQYLKWEPLSERRTKARLIIMYRIIKGEIAIPIDTADYNRDGVSTTTTVTTKLVPPPPRCDTHLGETSIHQIQTRRVDVTSLIDRSYVAHHSFPSCTASVLCCNNSIVF